MLGRSQTCPTTRLTSILPHSAARPILRLLLALLAKTADVRKLLRLCQTRRVERAYHFTCPSHFSPRRGVPGRQAAAREEWNPGLHTRRIRQGHSKPVQEVTVEFGSLPRGRRPMDMGSSASVRKVFFCNGPQRPDTDCDAEPVHL